MAIDLRVISTADVSLDVLREGFRDLPPEFSVEVREGQLYALSAESPSIVAFIADLDTWLAFAKTAFDWFGAGVGAAAGAEAWTHRDRIRKAVGAPVRAFARSLDNLRTRLHRRTRLSLRFPVAADDIHGSSLTLNGANTEDLQWEIAAFLSHLPAIAEVIRVEHLDEPNTTASPVFLTLREDGSLEIAWMDRKELKDHRRVIDLRSEE